MVTKLLERLLAEITDETGEPAVERVPDRAALAARVDTLVEILASAPRPLESLVKRVEAEKDFRSFSGRTRVRALVDHVRIALGIAKAELAARRGGFDENASRP